MCVRKGSLWVDLSVNQASKVTTQCASHIELPLGKSSGHSMKVREYKYELDCRRKECVEMNCERL
jgi:hypothetical protein